MDHQFIQRCYIFDNLVPLIGFVSFIFVVILAIWIVFVYNLRKDQAFPVHEILTFVPILKCLEDLLYYLKDRSCPWDNADKSQDAYIRMGQAISVILTYTFLHALLFMLSNGWNTTNQVVDRKQVKKLTLVMGVIFLVYSA